MPAIADRLLSLALLTTVCLLAPWLAAPTLAGQITPSHRDTPFGFGPGRSAPAGCIVFFELPHAQAIQCPLAVPTQSREIAGWGGYIIDLSPADYTTVPPMYMSIEVWHDGGEAHLLDHPHFPPPMGTMPAVFYPAGDGHKCVAGDQVFARFWCVGFPGRLRPWCAAELITHFRVAQQEE